MLQVDQSPQLDPIKDIGKPIFVVGTLGIKNGKVDIVAQDIKTLGGKEEKNE